jgi:hypothetical protein
MYFLINGYNRSDFKNILIIQLMMIIQFYISKKFLTFAFLLK